MTLKSNILGYLPLALTALATTCQAGVPGMAMIGNFEELKTAHMSAHNGTLRTRYFNVVCLTGDEDLTVGSPGCFGAETLYGPACDDLRADIASGLLTDATFVEGDTSWGYMECRVHEGGECCVRTTAAWRDWGTDLILSLFDKREALCGNNAIAECNGYNAEAVVQIATQDNYGSEGIVVGQGRRSVELPDKRMRRRDEECTDVIATISHDEDAVSPLRVGSPAGSGQVGREFSESLAMTTTTGANFGISDIFSLGFSVEESVTETTSTSVSQNVDIDCEGDGQVWFQPRYYTVIFDDCDGNRQQASWPMINPGGGEPFGRFYVECV